MAKGYWIARVDVRDPTAYSRPSARTSISCSSIPTTNGPASAARC
jgi:uncharacterized protein (DUF1330 family)